MTPPPDGDAQPRRATGSLVPHVPSDASWQAHMELEWLRWVAWLGCTGEGRARAEQCISSLEPGAMVAEQRRGLLRLMQRLLDDGEFPDLASVLRATREPKAAKAVGGDSAVLEVYGELPSGQLPASATHGLEPITRWLEEQHRLRKVSQAYAAAQRAIAEGREDEARDYVEGIEDMFAAPAEPEQSYRDLSRTALMGYLEHLKAERVPGVLTGFPELDAILGGMVPGGLWIIGARPSVGKTSLAIALCERLTHRGVPSALISAEDPYDVFGERILAREASITPMALRTGGKVSREAMERLGQVADNERLEHATVAELIGGTAQQAADAMRRAVRRRGARAAVVDYVQALKVPGAQDRRNEVRRATEICKSAGAHLGVPVIVLSQLNRHEGKPTMQNLRDAGELEQMAEAIMLMWLSKDGSERRMVVAKNKRGRAGGQLRVGWDETVGCVRELHYIGAEDGSE